MASALFRLNLASSALNYTCSGCTVDALLCVYSLRMESKHTLNVFGPFISIILELPTLWHSFATLTYHRQFVMVLAKKIQTEKRRKKNPTL